MKAEIPIVLIVSRLLMGFALILPAVSQITNFSIVAIIILTLGLLTDIFDGIIARKLGVSNQTTNGVA